MKIAVSAHRSRDNRDEVLKIFASHLYNNKNIKNQNDSKDIKSENKNLKEIKESKDTKDNKESKDTKDNKESKDTKDNKESKDKKNLDNLDNLPQVLVGDCLSGVDKFIRDYCTENKIPHKVFVANWNKYGNAAVMIYDLND